MKELNYKFESIKLIPKNVKATTTSFYGSKLKYTYENSRGSNHSNGRGQIEVKEKVIGYQTMDIEMETI